MTEQKHTPGPWTVREVSHSNVPGQRAFAIDFNEDQEQVVDWVYEEADAKLIAAAPELLAFAMHVHKCILSNGEYAPISIEHVSEVIAKATQ
jgi:hypothetical protein